MKRLLIFWLIVSVMVFMVSCGESGDIKGGGQTATDTTSTTATTSYSGEDITGVDSMPSYSGKPIVLIEKSGVVYGVVEKEYKQVATGYLISAYGDEKAIYTTVEEKEGYYIYHLDRSGKVVSRVPVVGMKDVVHVLPTMVSDGAFIGLAFYQSDGSSSIVFFPRNDLTSQHRYVLKDEFISGISMSGGMLYATGNIGIYALSPYHGVVWSHTLSMSSHVEAAAGIGDRVYVIYKDLSAREQVLVLSRDGKVLWSVSEPQGEPGKTWVRVHGRRFVAFFFDKEGGFNVEPYSDDGKVLGMFSFKPHILLITVGVPYIDDYALAVYYKENKYGVVAIGGDASVLWERKGLVGSTKTLYVREDGTTVFGYIGEDGFYHLNVVDIKGKTLLDYKTDDIYNSYMVLSKRNDILVIPYVGKKTGIRLLDNSGEVILDFVPDNMGMFGKVLRCGTGYIVKHSKGIFYVFP